MKNTNTNGGKTMTTTNTNERKTLTGWNAIEYAERAGCTLRKYGDPTEGPRDGLTVDEAREVAAEDPGLVWVETSRDRERGTFPEDG